MTKHTLPFDKEKLTPENKLRLRMIGVQSRLPKRINIQLYEFHFGKLSPQDYGRVKNTWLFKAMHEDVVKNFEILARKTKNI